MNTENKDNKQNTISIRKKRIRPNQYIISNIEFMDSLRNFLGLDPYKVESSKAISKDRRKKVKAEKESDFI